MNKHNAAAKHKSAPVPAALWTTSVELDQLAFMELRKRPFGCDCSCCCGCDCAPRPGKGGDVGKSGK